MAEDVTNPRPSDVVVAKLNRFFYNGVYESLLIFTPAGNGDWMTRIANDSEKAEGRDEKIDPSRRKWISPKVVMLPRLNELTLQSPVPGGGGTGGGGSTVVP
jgi:hypothetical protein